MKWVIEMKNEYKSNLHWSKRFFSIIRLLISLSSTPIQSILFQNIEPEIELLNATNESIIISTTLASKLLIDYKIYIRLIQREYSISVNT